MIKYNLFQQLYSLLFLLVFITSCNGQEKPKLSEGNQQTTKPVSSPLDTTQISEYVVNLFEDKKGNLWFGTISDGVARYDGKTLTYFTTKDGLCDNTVVSIVEDKEGNLWFGTRGGLSKYDGQTFTNFTSKQGLCDDRVSRILIDKTGNLWVGTWGGVCRFNGSTFSDFPLPKPDIDVPSYQATTNWVTKIMEDKQGNLWFGRSGYGACKYDGNSFTQFTKKEGLPSNCVQNILEDKKGNIWFGTRVAEKDNPDADKRTGSGGLSRYDGKTFIPYPEVEGLSKNDIYSIYEDKKGNLWIGATGLGVYRYDGQSFKLYKGTDRMDLTWSMGIQSILEDRNGTLWFGFSGGLFRFNGTAITNITKGGIKTNLPKENISEPKTIPIGQPKLIKNHFTNQYQAAADNVHCGLQDKAGNLWFGTTGDGVYRYDGKLFTNFTTKEGLNSNTVWSILEDTAGNIWIGTDAGVCLFNGKILENMPITVTNGLFSFTSPNNKATEKNDVWSMMQDKSGTIWFGTTAGVYCYNGKSFTRFLDNTSIVNKNGLSLKSVQCLLQDKNGNVWFGSGPMAFEGICLYDGKSLINFRPQNENWIRNIIEDKNGALLFATRRIGAYIYDGKNFSNFSQPKELLNGSFNYILEDKKGHIWYASDYGNNVGDNLGGVWRTDSPINKNAKKTFTKMLSEEVFWLLEDKNGNLWIGTRNTGLYRYDGKTFTNFTN